MLREFESPGFIRILMLVIMVLVVAVLVLDQGFRLIRADLGHLIN